MDILKQLKEVTISVLPIAVFASVLSLTAGVMDSGEFVRFIVSCILVIAGLTIFLTGTDVGLLPMGTRIGTALTKSRSLPILLGAAVILGFIITVPEPDVQVLASQVNQISSDVPVSVFLCSIAVGVGIFLALSLARTILSLPMKLILFISYLGIFLCAFFCDGFFVSVAFDSGGATTGPMAVPFIMAMGLGISASKNDDGDSSFGYAGLASIGPVLFVLILGLIFSGDLNSSVVSESASNSNLEVLFDVFKEVVSALAPLVIICALMQVFFLRMPRMQTLRIFIGFFYTFIGLIVFLFAVKCFFMPTATAIGIALASTSKIGLCVLAALLGASVVLAEPAIWVLTRQVEEVTQGHIERKILLIALSLAVSLAVLLSMVRILFSLSLWTFLLPGYILILLFMIKTPTLFVGIAFDSGGVATGPMSSTFLLPFAIGAATGAGGDIATASFGMIGLIAMMPIICIEALGLIYARALRKKEKEGDNE